MKIFRITAFTIVLVSLMAIRNSGEAKAGVIETVTGWNGYDGLALFGEPFTSFGQSFKVVGPDTVLNSFSLYLAKRLGDHVEFNFNVMEWNSGSELATGPVLFSSGMVSATSVGFEEFVFDTGDLNLNAGTEYIGIISTLEYLDGKTGDAWVGSRYDENAYADGHFFYQESTSSDSWSEQLWFGNKGVDYGDLVFTATFSAPSNSVPEPASFAIFGTLCLIAGAGRRRRKA